MPRNWLPAGQSPQHQDGYWAQLLMLLRQSMRAPHPGLPVVTQRSDRPHPPVSRGDASNAPKLKPQHAPPGMPGGTPGPSV